jgi:hypothetical protein
MYNGSAQVLGNENVQGERLPFLKVFYLNCHYLWLRSKSIKMIIKNQLERNFQKINAVCHWKEDKANFISQIQKKEPIVYRVLLKVVQIF